MSENRSKKIEVLRRRLRDAESAVVAFSGGVDSAVLSVLAFQELGNRMVAAMGVSPSVPRRDRAFANTFCQQQGIPFREIATNEFEDQRYMSNPANRCYFCKSELYTKFVLLAEELRFRYVFDGTLASDLAGSRPGFQAVKERARVVAPLVEATMTKEDIRAIARDLNLEVADKPNTACLASRLPTFTTVDPDLLRRIDSAEDGLRELGFRQVRVRHHGDVARVEVGREELLTAMCKRTDIERNLVELGWRFVTLDMAGYG
ncbi:MAG: ATP-dependent sacrificial sulfur transferase LarE [Deltaproteobacteria bacterium]|nr:ATP-dependent sacrificial sulfur transferase LarE [Deltaproteobacteria bacterium]